MKFNYRPLAELSAEMCRGPWVIVASGPSLDWCTSEIYELQKQGALFLLADSVARGFIERHSQSRRIIFSVENRPHGYLKPLYKEKLACYVGVNEQNISGSNELFRFHLRGEQPPQNSTELISPGTVVGCILAAFFYFYMRLEPLGRPPLYLLGLDLAYPENQLYSRLVKLNRAFDRLSSRELLEYEITLKKGSGLYPAGRHAIKTAAELVTARQNMQTLLDSVNFDLSIIDYSPLGLQHSLIEKRMPQALNQPTAL